MCSVSDIEVELNRADTRNWCGSMRSEVLASLVKMHPEVERLGAGELLSTNAAVNAVLPVRRERFEAKEMAHQYSGLSPRCRMRSRHGTSLPSTQNPHVPSFGPQLKSVHVSPWSSVMMW